MGGGASCEAAFQQEKLQGLSAEQLERVQRHYDLLKTTPVAGNPTGMERLMNSFVDGVRAQPPAAALLPRIPKR